MTLLGVAAILGILQGLTEFFPVSSSGHLALSEILLQKMGVPLPSEDLFFEVLLHVGTLLVVVGYYRREIFQFFHEWTRSKSAPTTTIPSGSCKQWTGYLLVSTLATVAIAIPFEGQIELAFREPLVVGTCLLITGGILVLAWWNIRNHQERTDLSLLSALVIGLAQGVALLPGISRSGATIGAALIVGVGRREAVTYSFLLSIPAILGGTLRTALEVEEMAWSAAFVGMICAVGSGWIALRFLVRWVVEGKLIGFSLYCFILGGISIILALVAG